MKSKLLLFTFLFVYLTTYSQVVFQKDKKNTLVSSSAYSMKISKDFNFLILGENSPQQGISATLNDKKSNIKISGLLYTGKKGVFTMEADLAASNGIYFFDQENGSEQGKVTFNFYKPIKIWSEYYKLEKYDKANVKLQTLDLLEKAKSEYEGLKKLATEVLDPSMFEADNDDEAITKLKLLSENYINKDDTKGYYELKGEFNAEAYIIDPKQNLDTTTVVVIPEFYDDVKPKKDLVLKKNTNKKSLKILKDYNDKRNFILNKLEDSINKLELESAKSKWAGTHTFFMGVSPFYERQSFKRFLYDASASFDDMFTTERGNVYGITLSLNYSLEKGEGSKNPYKPNSLFMRILVGFNRASNISNFRNSTLDIATPIGNDVNGNPITFTNQDKAFIGDTAYEYGFENGYTFETYYFPFPALIGFFGKIGYRNISFNSTSEIDDIELYPMRLGLLFSLKNKTEGKPVVTIQAFLDRTDLNLSPNGQDNDLRFGLGIGLPINFK